RDAAGAGLEDREQRDDRLRGLAQVQEDGLARTDTFRDQQVREPVRAVDQLGVCKRFVAVAKGGRVGSALGAPQREVVEQAAVRQRPRYEAMITRWISEVPE